MNLAAPGTWVVGTSVCFHCGRLIKSNGSTDYRWLHATGSRQCPAGAPSPPTLATRNR